MVVAVVLVLLDGIDAAVVVVDGLELLLCSLWPLLRAGEGV